MKPTRETLDSINALAAQGRVVERVAGAVADAPSVGGLWMFRIDGFHPVLLNKLLGVHWAAAGRLKKADREIIAHYASAVGVPRATGKRQVTLRIVLAKGQRGGDGDAYYKSALDALVKAGLLVDDNRQWAELMPVEYERAAKKATVITLEEV